MARVPERSWMASFRTRVSAHTRTLALAVSLAVLHPSVQSAAPVLDHLFPAAVQAGTSNTLTFVGKSDPWPPEVWSDPPGLTFEPTTNNGVFMVWAGTNATPGPRLVRAFNGEGVSAPRFLIVTREPQRAEVEPNGEWSAPQPVNSLPATINGRLEKNGDVDSYGFHLEAGQSLVAWMEAYTLMSPLDPVLRLLDSRGVQVAWNHDDGRSLDPFLAWTAPAAGSYVLQVFAFVYPAGSDIRFSGDARDVYRLHLTSGPVVRHTVPLGVQRGGLTALRKRGWNLGADTHQPSLFDGRDLGAGVEHLPVPPSFGEQVLDLLVGDGPEGVESEPNSPAAVANPMKIPGAVTGELETPGDEDRFAFRATKGELLLLEVQAASLGFPLDAWLRVEDPSGKELARNDDASGADPRLEWSAPEDGSYIVAIGNLLQHGGSDAWYRLALSRTTPSLKATVAENGFALEPGKTNEFKVNVIRRYGFNAPLTFSVRGLPEGVRADSGEVPEKGGECLVRLIATETAVPFSGSLQIRVVESGSGQEYPVTMDLVSVGENNGVPQGYRRLVVESMAKFWLTVLPTPKKSEDKK